jgi:spermidine synthase
LKINVDAMQARLDNPDQKAVARSLATVGFPNAITLLSTYAGRASGLAPWLANAQINGDLNMRLQYLAGMGLNFDRPVVIYDDILRYRTFPEDLFSGSDERMAQLRLAIAAAGSR